MIQLVVNSKGKITSLRKGRGFKYMVKFKVFLSSPSYVPSGTLKERNLEGYFVPKEFFTKKLCKKLEVL